MNKKILYLIMGIIFVTSISTIFVTNLLSEKNITAYDVTPEHLKGILEHCYGSKVFVGTVNLSYSNDTHSIDTENCKWQEIDKGITTELKNED